MALSERKNGGNKILAYKRYLKNHEMIWEISFFIFQLADRTSLLYHLL